MLASVSIWFIEEHFEQKELTFTERTWGKTVGSIQENGFVLFLFTVLVFPRPGKWTQTKLVISHLPYTAFAYDVSCV